MDLSLQSLELEGVPEKSKHVSRTDLEAFSVGTNEGKTENASMMIHSCEDSGSLARKLPRGSSQIIADHSNAIPALLDARSSDRCDFFEISCADSLFGGGHETTVLLRRGSLSE